MIIPWRRAVLSLSTPHVTQRFPRGLRGLTHLDGVGLRAPLLLHKRHDEHLHADDDGQRQRDADAQGRNTISKWSGTLCQAREEEANVFEYAMTSKATTQYVGDVR